ncbi:MAG: bifunctional DNA primase/polymerase [Anaerolineae bacterium]|nr:bifunctional DNA primase/polymerase [Anaerolineae bacterium]
MRQQRRNGEAAEYYVRSGLYVLPLHWADDSGCSCGQSECNSVGKHPLPRQGAKAASNDLNQIRDWWGRSPRANIGLNVGKSGLVVIDIDPYHGGDLRDVPLTPAGRYTPMVSTGGGGWHLYYEAPPNLEISNSNKRCPEGLDIRAGDGAYVVAPPSCHISGKLYQFVHGRELGAVRPLPLPASLLPILTIKNYPQEPETRALVQDLPEHLNDQHPYVQTALHLELDQLAEAREGARNTRLNEAAFNLGQFVGVGLLPRNEVEQLLTQAAMTIGLGEIETRKTIQSGLEAGIRTPRQNWPDV